MIADADADADAEIIEQVWLSCWCTQTDTDKYVFNDGVEEIKVNITKRMNDINFIYQGVSC